MEPATPFDAHAARVHDAGYHGHRGSTHSDVISHGILTDLREECQDLRRDLDARKVGCWLNVKVQFGEDRWAADLVIAEPDDEPRGRASTTLIPPEYGAAAGARPDARKMRLVMEHKSVITAHRNKNARFRELNTDMKLANDIGQNVILGVTILVGTAQKVLNVADGIRRLYKNPETGKVDEDRFEAEVGSRLRSKDEKVWKDFGPFVSLNRARDAENTAAYFLKNFPERSIDRWNQTGLDAILCVPVYYDNVGTAYVDRGHSIGARVDETYLEFIRKLARVYSKRWGSIRK